MWPATWARPPWARSPPRTPNAPGGGENRPPNHSKNRVRLALDPDWRHQVMASTQRLVTLSDPRSPVAEAYRTLRSNIQFSNLDHPARTILVTSAGSREGKSATLCNLAVTLAQSGTKTVVVDCDMRHPTVHEMFDLANDKGLSTLL